MEWARATNPIDRDLTDAYRACKMASAALSYRQGGGKSMTSLGFADMTAVYTTFNMARKDDGELYSCSMRRDLFSALNEVVDFGRLARLLDDLPGSFSRHSKYHKIVNYKDEAGRALPEHVIDQLDQQLDSIGRGSVYGKLSPDDVQLLARTVYVVLRDTGRRPNEIASLRFDCLDVDDGEWQLIWDNRKARRLNRRLPVFQDTVDAIIAWRNRMIELGFPTGKGAHLFPPVRVGKHMRTARIAQFIREWLEVLPEPIHSEIPGPSGVLLPYDLSLIYPYAFRHAYCQRHADAEVPLEVLMELMDHTNAEVTRGYYKVSLKRKREAAEVVRRHVLDREGRARPAGTALGYERKSVAVPWGNCTEPTNVVAGGQACPMRFQCSGCGFYERDPSYLPAIEDQIRRLKASRALAAAGGAAGYILDGYDGEIGDYGTVVVNMKAELAALPEDERRAVEEASKVLRKVRAGTMTASGVAHVDPGGRARLPLSVVRRPAGGGQ
ncbi:tyrosine-type recombinase/integrase [Kitasatospora sp. NPDC001574]